MENINSFLGYFEILDPPIAETSWSLLSLFPFSSYFLLFFNLDFFFLAIKTALHTTPPTKKKKKKKKKRTRKNCLPRNRFGKFTYGRSFG